MKKSVLLLFFSLGFALSVLAQHNYDNQNTLYSLNGNVGIAKNNPLDRLHLYLGNIRIEHQNPELIFQDISGSTFIGDFKYADNKLHYRWGQGIKHTFETEAYTIGDYNGVNEVKISRSGNSWFNGGNIGIGTINPDEKLTVKGKIHAEEVRVDLNVPPDYVFQKYYLGFSPLKENYKMLSLEEVEDYTKENHHLPDVPSASEIKESGLKLKEMTALLLQKIEELTLYTIEQEKRIKALEKKLGQHRNK